MSGRPLAQRRPRALGRRLKGSECEETDRATLDDSGPLALEWRADLSLVIPCDGSGPTATGFCSRPCATAALTGLLTLSVNEPRAKPRRRATIKSACAGRR